MKEALNSAVERLRVWTACAASPTYLTDDVFALICASVLGECPSALPSGKELGAYIDVGFVSVTGTDALARLVLPHSALIVVSGVTPPHSCVLPSSCVVRTLSWVKANVFDVECDLQRWEIFERLSVATYCLRVNALIAREMSKRRGAKGRGGTSAMSRPGHRPQAVVTFGELLGNKCSANIRSQFVQISTCTPVQLAPGCSLEPSTTCVQLTNGEELKLSRDTAACHVLLNGAGGAGIDSLAFVWQATMPTNSRRQPATAQKDRQLFAICFQNKARTSHTGAGGVSAIFTDACRACPRAVDDVPVSALPVALGTSDMKLPDGVEVTGRSPDRRRVDVMAPTDHWQSFGYLIL